MSEPAATQERSILNQLNNAKAKQKHVEVHQDAVIYNEKNMKVVRGIVYSILYSIPFWLIIILLVIWLV